MRGLVDYGSDSGSEAEENTPEVSNDKANSLPTPHPPLPKADEQADSYFAADDVFDGSSSLNLPSVIETGVSFAAEGELEDIVKPKEWELKMAEKEKRRREKKAKRKQKKEKKKEKEDEKSAVETLPVIHGKPKGKAKIAAFGALSAIADGVSSDSDEEQKSESVSAQPKPKGSGLLAMLPTPKGKSRINLGNVSGKGNGVLLPPSLRNKTKPTPAIKTVQQSPTLKRPAPNASDDSDDDDLPTDFFGLSSAPEPKVPKVGDIPLVTAAVDLVGPSLPVKEDDSVAAYGYPEVEPSSSGVTAREPEGVITDEEAHRLIMKYEVAPMGLDQRSFNSVAADIVDIRVDDALGPDVHANILKGLHKTARARDATAPLPKSKNPADVNAKRKHQITYLANLAVAREEALQQQWAESKQMRRMGRQKYGF